MPVPHSLEAQCYRVALWLCPPVFRREHGDEMSRDFDEARGEAVASGPRALWTLRLVIAIDLARTACAQWLRTGLPVIALVTVAVSVQLVIAISLAASVAIARRVARPIPDHVAQSEGFAVLFLAAITVLLIGMTIAVNLMVTRLNRRRRRHWSPSRQ
jgi:hypothetical protein